ncbi:ankyrin [Polychaeton citri CBS 116435]|uniref:Ankyrin n=1 Tax=Polychaeton citri CBS 116435 TaxID=1314669 RepID=A0A9P4UQ61_9PEZI|nr:ankyrin [Polychaeton citri CBS 116435]
MSHDTSLPVTPMDYPPTSWHPPSNLPEREPLLHRAVGRGSVKVVKTLLDNGARVNTVDNSGSSALFVAVRCQSTEIAEVLLSYGANPNRADATGMTLLEIAVELADDSLVKLLVQSGARIT